MITGQGSLDWRRGDHRLLVAEADFRRLEPTESDSGNFSGLAGELRIIASDLRTELLLAPWLDRAGVVRMRAEGTHFDLDGTYTLEAAAPGGARARAALTWRRGQTTLLTATVRSTGGAVRGNGTLDLDSLTGTLRLAGQGLPLELAEPWVDWGTLERFGAAGTVLDVEADLDLAGVRAARIAGRSDVVWRNVGDTLLAVAIRTLPVRKGLRLGVEGRLLPASPGYRRWAGELSAPGWSEIGAAGTVDGQAELEIPDLAAALADLRRRWPRLVPEIAYEPWIEGSLEAMAATTGRPASPHASGMATWRRPDGAILTLTAAGEPLTPQGEAHLRLEALELESLGQLAGGAGSELAGRVAGTLELESRAGAWSAALNLNGERLRWGPDFPEVDSATLEATSDGSTLRLQRLESRAGERCLVASGNIDLGQPPDNASPWPWVDRADCGSSLSGRSTASIGCSPTPCSRAVSWRSMRRKSMSPRAVVSCARRYRSPPCAIFPESATRLLAGPVPTDISLPPRDR